jgi:hypothetical protein
MSFPYANGLGMDAVHTQGRKEPVVILSCRNWDLSSGCDPTQRDKHERSESRTSWRCTTECWIWDVEPTAFHFDSSPSNVHSSAFFIPLGPVSLRPYSSCTLTRIRGHPCHCRVWYIVLQICKAPRQGVRYYLWHSRSVSLPRQDLVSPRQILQPKTTSYLVVIWLCLFYLLVTDIRHSSED